MMESFGLGITNCRPAREVVDGVRFAEDVGAEIAFVAEDVNCRDAFQLSAMSAVQTGRITLGPGVANPYTRNPTALAMSTATLDEISGGRAVLGLGASAPNLIHAQMGIEFGDSVGVLREATSIVRGLLRGESVSFAGDYFDYVDARLGVPLTRPRIPIFFAAMGPRTLRLAGGVADGVFLNVGASTEYVRWAIGRVHDGALGAGRNPAEITIAAWLTAYVTDDREAGLRRSRRWLSAVLSIPRQGEVLLERGGFDTSILPAIRKIVRAHPHHGDRSAAAELIPAEWAERMTLIGAPEDVRQRLRDYRDAGVQLPVLGLPALRALY
jgi:5,10-methylenetetrahydromethanopterin reductase